MRLQAVGWLESERQVTGVGEDVENSEPSYTAGGSAKWCFGNQSGSFSKSWTQLLCEPPIPLIVTQAGGTRT